jgi:hypothetical protein
MARDAVDRGRGWFQESRYRSARSGPRRRRRSRQEQRMRSVWLTIGFAATVALSVPGQTEPPMRGSDHDLQASGDRPRQPDPSDFWFVGDGDLDCPFGGCDDPARRSARRRIGWGSLVPATFGFSAMAAWTARNGSVAVTVRQPRASRWNARRAARTIGRPRTLQASVRASCPDPPVQARDGLCYPDHRIRRPLLLVEQTLQQLLGGVAGSTTLVA